MCCQIIWTVHGYYRICGFGLVLSQFQFGSGTWESDPFRTLAHVEAVEPTLARLRRWSILGATWHNSVHLNRKRKHISTRHGLTSGAKGANGKACKAGSIPLTYMESFSIFQLIVLALQPTTLLYWFTLTAPINLISSSLRQLISVIKL